MDPAGSPQHWPSAAQALADLSGPTWGWLADSDTQLCAACLAALTCQARGHHWGQWQELPEACEPDGEHLLIRLCARCGRDEVTGASCAWSAVRR
jgi:hypothetical protein